MFLSESDGPRQDRLPGVQPPADVTAQFTDRCRATRTETGLSGTRLTGNGHNQPPPEPMRLRAQPPPRPPLPPMRWGPRLGLAGCVVAFVVSYLGYVRTSTGQEWDQILFLMLTRDTPPALHTLARDVLTTLADLPVLVGAVLAIVVTAFLRRRVVVGLAAGATVPCSIGVSRLLKLFVLARPELGAETLLVNNSFPSG